MNVASPPGAASRPAELDRFDMRVPPAAGKPRASRNIREARVQAEEEFGCVDWYQYQVRTDKDDKDKMKGFSLVHRTRGMFGESARSA